MNQQTDDVRAVELRAQAEALVDEWRAWAAAMEAADIEAERLLRQFRPLSERRDALRQEAAAAGVSVQFGAMDAPMSERLVRIRNGKGWLSSWRGRHG